MECAAAATTTATSRATAPDTLAGVSSRSRAPFARVAVSDVVLCAYVIIYVAKTATWRVNLPATRVCRSLAATQESTFEQSWWSENTRCMEYAGSTYSNNLATLNLSFPAKLKYKRMLCLTFFVKHVNK